MLLRSLGLPLRDELRGLRDMLVVVVGQPAQVVLIIYAADTLIEVGSWRLDVPW